MLVAVTLALAAATITSAQIKNFTPVEGASLKAKIDNAVVKGKAGGPGGRFWVGYQFEVRPGVAIALHDDAKVEPLLTELIKRPVAESIRNRAIYWLGYTPESQSKNALLADIVRSTKESSDARQQAMGALGMSRAATTLPLLENLY